MPYAINAEMPHKNKTFQLVSNSTALIQPNSLITDLFWKLGENVGIFISENALHGKYLQGKFYPMISTFLLWNANFI